MVNVQVRIDSKIRFGPAAVTIDDILMVVILDAKVETAP